MDRKNKIYVTTMPPRRNTSTPSLKEREGGFNAPDFVDYETLVMLARASLVGLSPQEEAAVRAQAIAEAEEAVAAAEEAVAAAEEAMREADEAEAEADRLLETVRLMTRDYDRMNQAPGAMVSKPERKFD